MGGFSFNWSLLNQEQGVNENWREHSFGWRCIQREEIMDGVILEIVRRKRVDRVGDKRENKEQGVNGN